MRSRWLGPAVVAAMWAFAIAVYARLPQRAPSHWNPRGDVDGWIEKPWGPFVQPIIATVILAALLVLPRFDPRRPNREHVAEVRKLILNLLICFFAVVEGAMLGQALGWPIAADRAILAAIGLLLIGVGVFLPRIRSNWLLGFRTPWTLNNEPVWRATNRVGGRAFVAAGLVMLLASLLPPPARGWAAGAALGIAFVVPFAYSYVAYRRNAAGPPL